MRNFWGCAINLMSTIVSEFRPRGASPTRRLVLAAAAALLLPSAAGAQPSKRRRIAVLAVEARRFTPYFGAFREALHALGYGDDAIEIEIRYAGEHLEHLANLAAELAGIAPDVIVAGNPHAVKAAREATSTIPIVMVAGGDPVAAGFVTSLARPGGNVTGMATVSPEMAGKSLQLLKTAIPSAERIAILLNPGNRLHVLMLQVARDAARTLRTDLLPVEAGTPGEIDGAFAAMTRGRVEALVVLGDVVFNVGRDRIVELAASHNLPVIYGAHEFVVIGGLMSYGPDLTDLFRRAASYVDKILKGAKPADLPVEQPTKFQLVVNLKTAQALGLTIPTVILAGADEVIE